MLDYNVPRGKLNRGLAIVETYKLLKEGDELSEEEILLACVLGWCNEWSAEFKDIIKIGRTHTLNKGEKDGWWNEMEQEDGRSRGWPPHAQKDLIRRETVLGRRWKQRNSRSMKW